MKQPIIEILNVGKQYSIVDATRRNQFGGNQSLREAVKSMFFRRRSSDEKLEENTRFWALNDINLKIYSGDVVGVIGKNGSGKSTLLKILSRITEPTSGKITLRGSTSSLLEAGTGFHPELTGRENVFLNGVILGMSKGEIQSCYDSIVDFSGVRKFMDTPIKRYSTGMVIRLAFSVAAHLETDIMVIDEVLAVGDVEFQEKCMSRMDDFSKKRKKTILFVSHNMNAVRSLCNRAVLLNKGCVVQDGKVESVVAEYTRRNNSQKEWTSYNRVKETEIRKVEVTNEDYELENNVTINLEIESEVEIDVAVQIVIHTSSGQGLGYCAPGYLDKNTITLNRGKSAWTILLSAKNWAIGTYSLSVGLLTVSSTVTELIHNIEDAIKINIVRNLKDNRLRYLEQAWNTGLIEVPISIKRCL